MIHDKNSIDYHINKAELEDMEIYVPMTLRERTAIRSWVKRGNTIESNPWEYRDSSGELMNYLQAYRSVLAISEVPGTTGMAKRCVHVLTIIMTIGTNLKKDVPINIGPINTG